jgi:hypothetical protein
LKMGLFPRFFFRCVCGRGAWAWMCKKIGRNSTGNIWKKTKTGQGHRKAKSWLKSLERAAILDGWEEKAWIFRSKVHRVFAGWFGGVRMGLLGPFQAQKGGDMKWSRMSLGSFFSGQNEEPNEVMFDDTFWKWNFLAAIGLCGRTCNKTRLITCSGGHLSILKEAPWAEEKG